MNKFVACFTHWSVFTCWPMTGQSLGDTAAPDSYNTLDALLGKSDQGRAYIVQHANGVALRMGDWKLMPDADGGWAGRGKKGTRDKLGPWGWYTTPRGGALFNLADDPGETKNVSGKHPAIKKQMSEKLKSILDATRTRP